MTAYAVERAKRWPLTRANCHACRSPTSTAVFPRLEYAQISLARDLIRDRKGVGLSQQRLADLAGVRQETLSRIETGKHTASPRTVDKIMRAIEAQRRRLRTKKGV